MGAAESAEGEADGDSEGMTDSITLTGAGNTGFCVTNHMQICNASMLPLARMLRMK